MSPITISIRSMYALTVLLLHSQGSSGRLASSGQPSPRLQSVSPYDPHQSAIEGEAVSGQEEPVHHPQRPLVTEEESYPELPSATEMAEHSEADRGMMEPTCEPLVERDAGESLEMEDDASEDLAHHQRHAYYEEDHPRQPEHGEGEPGHSRRSKRASERPSGEGGGAGEGTVQGSDRHQLGTHRLYHSHHDENSGEFDHPHYLHHMPEQELLHPRRRRPIPAAPPRRYRCPAPGVHALDWCASRFVVCGQGRGAGGAGGMVTGYKCEWPFVFDSEFLTCEERTVCGRLTFHSLYRRPTHTTPNTIQHPNTSLSTGYPRRRRNVPTLKLSVPSATKGESLPYFARFGGGMRFGDSTTITGTFPYSFLGYQFRFNSGHVAHTQHKGSTPLEIAIYPSAGCNWFGLGCEPGLTMNNYWGPGNGWGAEIRHKLPADLKPGSQFAITITLKSDYWEVRSGSWQAIFPHRMRNDAVQYLEIREYLDPSHRHTGTSSVETITWEGVRGGGRPLEEERGARDEEARVMSAYAYWAKKAEKIAERCPCAAPGQIAYSLADSNTTSCDSCVTFIRDAGATIKAAPRHVQDFLTTLCAASGRVSPPICYVVLSTLRQGADLAMVFAERKLSARRLCGWVGLC